MSELPVDTVFKTYITRGLPRMVLPDLWWIGGCTDPRGAPLRNPAVQQRPMTEMNHGHCVAYVILGSKKTIMVDPGHFGLWYTIDGQLDKVLGDRPLDYIYVSHQEIPHTGNLGRLMAKYPSSIAIGDVRDYHLFHPEVELARFQHTAHGEGVDLGDRQFLCLDAIWKDLSGTMWAYDTKLKLFFGADLFGFIHTDEDNVCGTMFHELAEADFQRLSDRHAMPFFGRGDRDQDIRVAAFRNLLKKYPIEVITSGHVGPIMGPRVPIVIEKLLAKVVEPPAQPNRPA
jgi:flavorubredoxin